MEQIQKQEREIEIELTELDLEIPKQETKRKDTLLWAIQYLQNDILSLNEDLIRVKKLLRKEGIKVFNTRK